MSDLSLAATTFSAGPQDDLAAVDVYAKRVAQSPVNSIQDLAKKTNVDLSTVLRGGQMLSSQLPIIGGYNQLGGMYTNKQNLVSRLLGASRIASGVLRNIPPDLATSMMSGIPNGNQIYTTIAGVTNRVSYSNLGSLTEIGSIINDVSGNPTLFSVEDRDGTVGLLGGIVMEATRYGIPNSYGSLMASVSNPYVIQKVSALVLPTAVKNSDTQGLSSIADKTAYGSVRMMNPNVLNDFSSGYKAPLGCSASDYSTNYSQVTDAFRKVDNQWDTGTRNNQSVLNLTTLQGSSPDFQRTIKAGSLTSTNSDEKLYALASLFPPTTVDAQIRQQFPATVLGGNSLSNNRVVDPRTLVDSFSSLFA